MLKSSSICTAVLVWLASVATVVEARSVTFKYIEDTAACTTETGMFNITLEELQVDCGNYNQGCTSGGNLMISGVFDAADQFPNYVDIDVVATEWWGLARTDPPILSGAISMCEDLVLQSTADGSDPYCSTYVQPDEFSFQVDFTLPEGIWWTDSMAIHGVTFNMEVLIDYDLKCKGTFVTSVYYSSLDKYLVTFISSLTFLMGMCCFCGCPCCCCTRGAKKNNLKVDEANAKEELLVKYEDQVKTIAMVPNATLSSTDLEDVQPKLTTNADTITSANMWGPTQPPNPNANTITIPSTTNMWGPPPPPNPSGENNDEFAPIDLWSPAGPKNPAMLFLGTKYKASLAAKTVAKATPEFEAWLSGGYKEKPEVKKKAKSARHSNVQPSNRQASNVQASKVQAAAQAAKDLQAAKELVHASLDKGSKKKYFFSSSSPPVSPPSSPASAATKKSFKKKMSKMKKSKGVFDRYDIPSGCGDVMPACGGGGGSDLTGEFDGGLNFEGGLNRMDDTDSVTTTGYLQMPDHEEVVDRPRSNRRLA